MEEPQYQRTERGQGRFYRRFVLPDTVDSDKVNATSKNGVLTIHDSETSEGDASPHPDRGLTRGLGDQPP